LVWESADGDRKGMGDTSWDTGRNRDFLWEFHAVSINGDTPIAGWFISWKILLNWMILGVPFISGFLHMDL